MDLDMLSSMAKKVPRKKERRKDVTIEKWLREAIALDEASLGHGSRNNSGSKGVFSAALALYLAMPVEARRELAVVARDSDPDRARRMVEAHWIVRMCRAVTSLGAGAVDRVEQFAAMEGGSETRSGTSSPDHAAASPGRRSRRGA